MAQASATPAITTFTSATSPLQPYAGLGPVVRTVVVPSTGSAFSISVSGMTATGMTGLMGVAGVSICSTSAYIITSNATSNGDGTIGASAGPWVFTQSDSRACDWSLTLISRT